MNDIFNSKYYKQSVALIAPKFFGYEKEIMKEIQKKGGEVSFFSEMPNIIINRILHNFFPKLRRFQCKRYENRLLKKIKHNRYTILIAIRSEILTPEFYKKLRSKLPKAYFILYEWDSIKYIDYSGLINVFDTVFTFDRQDADKNSNLKYCPLFYTDNFVPSRNTSYKYDIAFVGSVKDDRQYILSKMMHECEKETISYFFYLYFPLMTYIKMKFNGSVNMKPGLKSLRKENISDIFANAKVILDINTVEQNGLAMRIFEALASGKKIITCNENIKYEKEIPNSNYYVIDRNNIVLNKSFIDRPYVFHKNFYNEYSLSSWLEKLVEYL
jgi:hypothetical protein